MKDENQSNQPVQPEQVPGDETAVGQSGDASSSEPYADQYATASGESQPIDLAVEAEPATVPDRSINDVVASQTPREASPLQQPSSVSDSAYNAADTRDASISTATPTPATELPQPSTAPLVTETGAVDTQAAGLQTAPATRGKKFIIGSVIAGMLLLLGGGGVAAYTMWYQNPDKVLSDAVVNMVQAETVTYTGSLELMNLASGSESSMSSDLKSMKLSVDGKSNSVVGDTSATLTVDYAGKTYDVNGAVIVDTDANLYVKVGGIKKILTKLATDGGGSYDELPQYIRDVITKLDDKWVRIASEDLKDLDQDYDKTKSCSDEVFKKLRDDKAMTDELVDIYKQNMFVVVKETLPSKDGSLGYVIDADTKIANAFAKAANKSKLAGELKKCDESFDFSDESIDESFKTTDTKESVGETRVEVWVDRWSHELTKVSFSANSKEATLSTVIEPVFNKSVEVNAPKEFIKVSELKKIYEDAMKQFEQTPVVVPETTTDVMSSSFSAEV